MTSKHVWAQPVFDAVLLRSKTCRNCDKTAILEYAVTHAGEPTRFTVWTPLCQEHKASAYALDFDCC